MNPASEPEPPEGQNDAAAGAMIGETAASWIARQDAGLSTSEHCELNAWLAADPRHSAAFGEYRSAWAALDRPVSGGAVDHVIEALHRIGRRQCRRRAFSGALAMALSLAGISIWTLSREHATAGNEVIASSAQVLLPERQTLPDGTVVELKEGAEILPDFGITHRRVALLRGEAHFQVANDAARPFVVEVNGVSLRAVGTEFAVQLGDTSIELIVTEGRVAVEKSPVRGPVPAQDTVERTPRRTLGAGEQAMIDFGSAMAKVRPIAAVEVSERLAWRAPRLEFSGTPLSEVVALLNRHAAGRDIRFSLEDPSIEDVRVSGLFRADNTAALLELLESGFGITAERRGESEIALRKTAGWR